MSTPNEGALVNPLSAINQEAYDESHSTAINLGITALSVRVRERRTRLDAAVRQAGDDFDVARITGDLKGDTDAGTLGRVVDEHSALAADQEVLNQQRAIQASVRRRAAADQRNEDDPVYDQMYEPVRAEPPVLSHHVQAAMRERGIPDFRAAHQGNVSFDFSDFDPRIYADLTRGAPGDAPNQWDSAASPPWSPETARTVMLGRARLSMLDLIPSGTIGAAQHIYYREVSPSTGATSGAAHTVDASRASSSAAARSEGASLAESTFQDIRVADTVESIGHFARVTMEQLEDSARVASMLDTRMPYGVRQAVNRAILNGNGTSPQIKGFLAFKYSDAGADNAAKARSISETFSRVTVDISDNDTEAKAAKDAMLKVRRAMTTLLLEGATEASGVVLHPRTLELIQTAETASAGFYYGDPRVMPAKLIWGLPVVEDQYGLGPYYGSQGSTDPTAGDTVALLGDFAMQAEVLYRSGLRVEFGMAADDFLRLRESVRAYVRLVLSIYRLKAFITIEAVA